MPTITGSTYWFRIFGDRVDFMHGGSYATTAFLALIVIGIVSPLWAIGQAIVTPKSAFRSLGKSKGRWIGVMIVLFLLGDLSVFLPAIYYLIRIRPQLNVSEHESDSERGERVITARHHLGTKENSEFCDHWLSNEPTRPLHDHGIGPM